MIFEISCDWRQSFLKIILREPQMIKQVNVSKNSCILNPQISLLWSQSHHSWLSFESLDNWTYFYENFMYFDFSKESCCDYFHFSSIIFPYTHMFSQCYLKEMIKNHLSFSYLGKKIYIWWQFIINTFLLGVKLLDLRVIHW